MDAIQELLAKQAIYELSCRYMRGLDRLHRASLESVFSRNAYCEYGFINGTPEEFIDYALNALQSHHANHHMIGNALIEFGDEEAFGEIYFHAYHKIEGEEAPLDLIIAGRYIDRYVLEDGVWKIAYRSERNDWSRTQATADPYFASAPSSLTGSRRDDVVFRRDNRKWPKP